MSTTQTNQEISVGDTAESRTRAYLAAGELTCDIVVRQSRMDGIAVVGTKYLCDTHGDHTDNAKYCESAARRTDIIIDAFLGINQDD